MKQVIASKRPSSNNGLPTTLEFFSSPKYLGLQLSSAQTRILETFYSGEGQDYQELILVAGMRGGKSMLSAGIILYELYSLLEMQERYNAISSGSFAEYWRVNGVHISDGQNIHVAICMNSLEQADATIYALCKGLLREKECFKKFDLTEMNHYTYKCKSVILTCLTPDSTTNVGRVYKAIVYDEMPRMEDHAGGKLSIQEVFKCTQKGVATFKEYGKIVVCGSPLYCNDYTMELLLTSSDLFVSERNVQDIESLLLSSKFQNKVSGRVGFNLTTFEMNPMITIDQEHLQSMLVSHPHVFRRDYEAFSWNEVPDKKTPVNQPPDEVSSLTDVLNHAISDLHKSISELSECLQECRCDPNEECPKC